MILNVNFRLLTHSLSTLLRFPAKQFFSSIYLFPSAKLFPLLIEIGYACLSETESGEYMGVQSAVETSQDDSDYAALSNAIDSPSRLVTGHVLFLVGKLNAKNNALPKILS